MSFRNPEHHAKHHHHQQQHGWNTNTTYDSRVYFSPMEPMPSKLLDPPRTQNPYVTFSEVYEDRIPVTETTRSRVKVTEYEGAGIDPATNGYYKVYEENVDTEADDFIKFEHKKFAANKWMSMKEY